MSSPHLTRRNLFGREDPSVTIGCAPLASMPDTFTYTIPEEIAHATIRTALGSPLNWLDTAAAYGDGESERRIGSVLRELGGLPHVAFLDTKVGASPSGNFSAEMVKQLFERSQDLLGIEQFDLVFLHDPEKASFDEITASGGPLSVLLDYRKQGRITHLGGAGGPVDLMMRYVETDLFDAVITLDRCTLLDRSAEPLVALCREQRIPLLNAAPYGSGVLAKGPSHSP